MAICANQGRMYVGTARQYMEKPCCQREQEDWTPRARMRGPEGGCQPDSICADMPLAAAYVNPQPYTGMVSPEMGLSRGSIFNNLYDPWKPEQYC